MRKRSKIWYSLLLLLTGIVLYSCQTERVPEPDQEIYRKVDSLLSEMSIEEKAGQMLNIGLPALLTGEFYSPRDTLIFDKEKVQRLLVEYGAGSVQNLGFYPLTREEWKFYIGQVQKTVLENTRLKIPVIYGIDAVHGANYTAGSVMFPHQINLAATFNTENARKVGEVTAYEVRASFTPWNYAPMIDVARNPLWGRIFETYGEDPYVVARMGEALIEGMQGEFPLQSDKLLVCGKHFIGYGAPDNGKDRSPATLTEKMIREIHLPPFKAAIQKGMLSVMLSAGSVNGIPSHADRWLITEVLKEELEFKGVVIGDWGEIDNLHAVHKVAKDEREAVKLSVLAGIDMCMEPYDESFAVHLVDLVRSGEIPEARVNDAVRRILYLKYKAGLFEDPFLASAEYPEFASEESHQLNLEIARESITLLKNNSNMLPLSGDEKILVTGVAAHSLTYLNGGWSRTWSGQDPQFNDPGKLTIYEALKEELGGNSVDFAQGTDYMTETDISEAVRKATMSDIIVACLGEQPATEKPSDIENLDMPEVQVKLVKELAKTGKPVILVLVQGRPRIIRQIEPLADAILMAYLPGNEGGRAVTDVLLGRYNPGGRLPYTWPRYSGSLWTYDHLLSDERDVNFGLKGFTPQYEFGHGLSYTEFEYGKLTLNTDTLMKGDSLEVNFSVSNTGAHAGTEAVLLFISDELASVSPPVKKLKRFNKIKLSPGESMQLSFRISEDDLRFFGKDKRWIIEEGYFTLRIADQEARFFYRNK